MKKHVIPVGLAVLAMAAPAMARMWKPSPAQIASDYTLINHNKGADGRVTLQWLAPTTMATPVMQQLLDRYVVISIAHLRALPGGGTSWDDVQGVQVLDAAGKPLTEIPPDAYAPALVGLFATTDAIVRQSTQGRGKTHWGVYEPGTVHACAPGKLQVVYDGETYSWDTPMPGCPKN